jgi:hypothetical protein
MTLDGKSEMPPCEPPAAAHALINASGEWP